MKTIVLFGLIALMTVASSADDSHHSRGCLYNLGICDRECEEGTHSYAFYGTGCGNMTPEPTCEQPYPIQEDAIICDYSACYCDAPTVRNTKTNECVFLDECP